MHSDTNGPARYHDWLPEVTNTLVADPEKAELDSNAEQPRASGNSPGRIAEQILEIYPKGVRLTPGVVGVYFDGFSW